MIAFCRLIDEALWHTERNNGINFFSGYTEKNAAVRINSLYINFADAWNTLRVLVSTCPVPAARTTLRRFHQTGPPTVPPTLLVAYSHWIFPYFNEKLEAPFPWTQYVSPSLQIIIVGGHGYRIPNMQVSNVNMQPTRSKFFISDTTQTDCNNCTLYRYSWLLYIRHQKHVVCHFYHFLISPLSTLRNLIGNNSRSLIASN